MRFGTKKFANQRPSTVTDVARLAGVSTATVLRALNDPASVAPGTCTKIMSAISGLQYSPNTSAVELGRQNVGVQRRRGPSLPAAPRAAATSRPCSDVAAGNWCQSEIIQRLHSLEDENRRLKRLVAHLSIDLEALRAPENRGIRASRPRG